MATFSIPFFMGDPMTGFAVPEPHREIAPPLPDGTPQERMGVLYRYLAEAVADTDNPVVFAGDCVSIIGVLAGLHRRGIEPTLLFFDAHGDFHTWETTHSEFIGGMPLAMVTGRGEQTILTSAGLEPIPEHRAVLIDGRDLDPGEDEAVARSGVEMISVEELPSHIPDGPLYVHIDADVVDPSDMPAMNYPAPDGPSLAAVIATVGALAATGRVVAFSLSSWNPAKDGASRAAAACERLAAPFLK